MAEKKNIVILHGWGGNPSTWDDVKDYLQRKGFKVYVPYLPGFDKPLNKPFELEDYVSWLYGYTKNLKINPIVLVGHSNGGRIASSFAYTYPGKVKKLILVASSGIPPGNRLKVAFFKFLSKIGKSLLKIIFSENVQNYARSFIYRLAGEKDYLEATPVMKKTMQNLLKKDLTETFIALSVPTLIIWGKSDRYTPYWMGKKIHELVKNSKLTTLETGHGIHLSHPDQLSESIAGFARTL